MNYWKQFAEMLGLELEQEFVITDLDGKRQDTFTYKFTEDGLSIKKPTIIGVLNRMPAIFTNVLDGDYKVVPKPLKPKKGEAYWHYSKGWEQATFRNWEGTSDDLCTWKCGSCFRTEEEANTKGKEIIEQLQKEYEEA